MKPLARTAAAFAAAMALAGAAAADTMYKWVDEKGVTHFSEDPPPDGKAQKIDVKPPPPSSNAAPARAQDWREREIDLRQKRVGREQAEEKARQDAQRREARCLNAQRQLDMLRRERPIYTVDRDGERVYMDDKERAAERQKAQEAAAANCR